LNKAMIVLKTDRSF